MAIETIDGGINFEDSVGGDFNPAATPQDLTTPTPQDPPAATPQDMIENIAAARAMLGDGITGDFAVLGSELAADALDKVHGYLVSKLKAAGQGRLVDTLYPTPALQDQIALDRKQHPNPTPQGIKATTDLMKSARKRASAVLENFFAQPALPLTDVDKLVLVHHARAVVFEAAVYADRLEQARLRNAAPKPPKAM